MMVRVAIILECWIPIASVEVRAQLRKLISGETIYR
jgi:hypothetical protein